MPIRERVRVGGAYDNMVHFQSGAEIKCIYFADTKQSTQTMEHAQKKARKDVMELAGLYGNGQGSNPCRALHTTRLIQLGLRSPCV